MSGLLVFLFLLFVVLSVAVFLSVDRSERLRVLLLLLLFAAGLSLLAGALVVLLLGRAG